MINMNFWNVLFLGCIEGVTEFLPISSTGHLILASRLMGLEANEFLKTFEIAIQLGAILSVVVIYWRLIFSNIIYFRNVMIAFCPTVVIGFLLYRTIKGTLLGNPFVVLWALLLGGIAIIVLEKILIKKDPTVKHLAQVRPVQAFILGVFQSFSVIPGVSRAAATILGGLGLGLDRKTVVEFSFLLAIPTMTAATGYDLLKNGTSFSAEQWTTLLFGSLVSFLVAWMSIKFLLHYIKKNNFVIFGYYRIFIALVLFLILRKG